LNGWLLEGLSAETPTSVTYEGEDIRRNQTLREYVSHVSFKCVFARDAEPFLLVIVGRFANIVKTHGQELVQFGC